MKLKPCIGLVLMASAVAAPAPAEAAWASGVFNPECIPEQPPSQAMLTQMAMNVGDNAQKVIDLSDLNKATPAYAELVALRKSLLKTSETDNATKPAEPAKSAETTKPAEPEQAASEDPAITRIKTTIADLKAAEKALGANTPASPTRQRLEASLAHIETSIAKEVSIEEKKPAPVTGEPTITHLLATTKAALAVLEDAKSSPERKTLSDGLGKLQRELIFSSKAMREAAKVKTPAVQALNKFEAMLGNGNTLVTTELVSAYTPFGRRNCGGKAVGIRAAVTASSNTDDMVEYGRQQLLLHDGALINASLSYTKTLAQASLNDLEIVALGQSEDWRAIRATYTDRLYSARAVRNERSQFALWGYFLNGLTVKGIKTDKDSDGPNRAVGSIYLGGGYDGPLFETNGPQSASGGVDFNVRASAHWLGRNTIADLTATPGFKQSHYFTAGVTATAYLVGQFSAKIEYQTAVGGARRALGDLAMFSIGYGKPAPAKEEAQE